jgi:cytochrome b6-f complex iron-sulfur subunit
MLLRDEAMLREDAKTEAMAINAFVHTLDRAEVKKRAEKVLGICNEIHAGLDEKESALGRRSAFLIPAWGFAAIFSFFMYRKYLSLKHAYVVGPDGSAAQPPSSAMATRRRLLDAVLSVMGAVTLIGLMWPAVTYVLPARKQGGGGERVAAGSDGDWEVWTARKVSVRGKPVAVIRTDKGYRAFSAVCTHLGCIVHWDAADRELKCPCHAAAFDAAGQVVSGPPPRGLPEYGVMVAQGQVIVTQPLEG